MAERNMRRTGRRFLWLPLFVCLFIGVYAYWSRSTLEGKQKTAPPPPSTPVTAAAVSKGDIHIYINGLGSVTPLKTVTVRTRVDGQVLRIYYREGQIVNAGAPLVEIDSRPFQAQLTQAQGQMIRDRALWENGLLDLARFEKLIKRDSISRQQYDTQKSLVRQYEGAVKADQGQIDSAKLQIEYAHITAPISGRIGLRTVDEGNIVHATDTNGLLVITQVEPMSVIFPIPEDRLPSLLDKIRAGKNLPVEAFNREQTRKLSTGTLLAHDNQIDSTTGTIRLRAKFANKDHELFPNQFVNARVLVETLKEAVVIPRTSIQRSPQGTFVYLIKEDLTVAVRPVKVGAAEGDNVAIEEGLSPGELVVVEGVERLREGSHVQLKKEGTETPNKAK